LIARENIQIRIEDQENIARLTPPLHYNCRTIIVAITTLDEPIAFTDPSVLGQIKGLTKVV
jgi:hypothetical protein